jgi:hypothetical protein
MVLGVEKAGLIPRMPGVSWNIADPARTFCLARAKSEDAQPDKITATRY